MVYTAEALCSVSLYGPYPSPTYAFACSVMITGIASDGVYDLLFQYLKLKLGFTTKDLVSGTAALHAALCCANLPAVPRSPSGCFAAS